MPRKGREFEKMYEWLYQLGDKYKVTSPAMLIDKASGGEREVDVLLEFTDDQGFPRKISIECRDRNSVADVTWIEQVIQKKIDLNLDSTIVATTNHFSQQAVNKAKHYNIVIEKAELLTPVKIEEIANIFYIDVYFFKFQLKKFELFKNSGETISLRNHMNSLNIFQRSALISEINSKVYLSIDPNQILDEYDKDSTIFFEKQDNHITVSSTCFFNTFGPFEHCDKFIGFTYEVVVYPFKKSLPLTKCASSFDGATNSNKNYRAMFGNSEDGFEIGYLDGRLIGKFTLTPMKYLRFAGANLSLNTIIPSDVTFQPDLSYFTEHWLGEFDLSMLEL